MAGTATLTTVASTKPAIDESTVAVTSRTPARLRSRTSVPSAARREREPRWRRPHGLVPDGFVAMTVLPSGSSHDVGAVSVASRAAVASRYASSGVRPSRRATMYGAYQFAQSCLGAVG